jgi:branched-chain amino acid transport system ATP-binding protein
VAGGYRIGADILHGIDLALEPGEIVVIVGPNGAGKSTFMKAVFGLIRISGGTIHFDGADITRRQTEAIVRLGICYVPQERNIFPSLTVQENLEMGAFIRTDDWRPQMEKMFELFPRLKERRRQPAGQMSGGERQMVAMGRALMMEPSVLLLDEPSAGLSPVMQDEVFVQTRRINRAGVSVVMVEQNASRCLQICDRGYVLDQGRNAHTGTGAELARDPKVIELYLGTLAKTT